ncbi:hypothetical protein F4813DRAFT_131244 [Daldinia decipiens]|uniref:uncharacterized protein n=1 Tax=Daldinia decipiens TaxID=326647 RepID=UPI0020C42617|nr:uncharacterized protein F4813DRAFT_131244 [Daldinia decipiens]KAI1656314.1 hypothetical protein F4813DRAFT_131244 [Daldinia decipiens]
MATPGTTQALLAAFFFGILFNAASAGLVLYAVGHGSAIFRDGLRLVLILFLTSSAAWALVEFLATIIEPTAASMCQVAVVFSSIFDQMARVFVEQYLVWAARTEKKSIPNIVSQFLILVRFGVGMAFIGLTQSDFNPTCVPISSVPPIAITTIVLDAIILALIPVQVLSSASTSGVSSNRQAPLGKRSVILVTVGLAIWIGTSVVLLLGQRATDLVLRTTLPAVGLAILVALVTVLSGSLVTPRGPPLRRPDSPTTRDIGRDRDLSSSDSADYPPSRYEDVKAANATTITAYVSRNDAVGTGTFGNAKKNTKGKAWNKTTAGKLVISKPVLISQEGMENPLDRILTVDLATAAREEKERRVKLLQRESTLIAQRPAPQPPTAPGRDVSLARELSLKRKEVGSSSLAQLERTISAKTTKTSAGLSVEANASSTSSELSPGTEQVRRRSPRHLPAPPIPATFQPIRPGEPVRIPIPRPRDPSPSPKEPEPVKTPLQRRATTGLPSHPRAQAMKQIAKDARNSRHETVMFINNIVYDDPNAVSNIVQGASKTPITSLDSDDSVVNRPRPIPRKGDNDRQVFPAEVSPAQAHKRSKSSGSIIARRSMLRSVPGSPSQLPPLPPPPKSAGNLSHLRPIHTKSMSLEEKMDLLYPTPLSAPSASTRNKQKSIVPKMPSLPTYTISIQRPNVEDVPDSGVHDPMRLSKATDRSSTRTISILGIDDIPQQGVQKADSSHNAIEELGQSWLPGISAGKERQSHPSHDKMNRKSPPSIPTEVQFNGSSSKDESEGREGYASTIWGSVHSPVAAVNIQISRQNAHSTYIQKDTHGSGKQEHDHPATVVSGDRVRNFVEDKKALPKVPTIEKVNTGSFHRRVGDECPAFSTRKGKGRLRKMPPPAPLILNGRSNKRAILVQPAEPSPLESPEAAYQMIQAQLQRFEEPNRDSVDSEGQRLALLENLEREMGQLQNKWQSTQNLLQRDSMSSIKTSPAKDSRPPSIIGERRASRKTPMRIGIVRSKDESSTGTPSSQSSGTSSENTRSSQWQARLASAQTEEIEGTPDLIMKHNNLNFLSVSKAALGSPSPPDTEESEYESELPMSIQPLGPRLSAAVAQIHELWKPQSPAQRLVSTGLWAGVVKQSQAVIGNLELPSQPLRSVSRKTWAPLAIESSRLWKKTTQSNNTAVYNGLWKKYTPSQNLEFSRAVTRPVTIRPPRRSKRVSLLPDILENPVPLPDKQGTLGLFQFPWGERSESASIQLPPPTRMFTAMPGTMTTGALVTNAFSNTRSSQPDAEEFTTSFFDDYEAEEEGDNFDNFEDFADSDGDDFDENTLWEIASLLRTEVPSRDSLLLAQRGSPSVNSPGFDGDNIDTIMDDYNADGMVLEDPIPIDQSYISIPDPTPSQTLLWTAQLKSSETRHTLGLPQPDSATWESYKTEPRGKSKSNHRIKTIMSIESIHLWKPRAGGIDLNTGLLWSACKPAHIPSQTTKVTEPTQSASLWALPIAVIDSEEQGLFDVSRPREDYRRTSNEPAALFMKKKPRTVEMPLEKLVSRALWTANGHVVQFPLLWKTPAAVAVSEHDGLFNVSIVRSDYRRTVKEPAAISMGKTTSRVLGGPLASLQTNDLWTKESVSQPTRGAELFLLKMSAMKTSQPIETEAMPKFQTALLWEKPKISAAPEHEGLFDVSATRYDYRRTSKAPAAIAMPKKSRSNKEPLPSITTTSLWTRETPAPIVELAVPSKVSSPSRTNLLWEQFNSPVLVSNYEGLFDANVVRIDYRRTSKLPAAISMTQRTRKMGESLTTLTSTRLWAKSVKSSYASTKTISLWSKPTAPVSFTSGLFQLDPTRKTYRTTSAEPVALQMSRKPRFTSTPLPIIKSSRLWSNSQITSVELDWMIISSVRPRSPSVASISTVDSLPISPVLDSSSVKTSITKASSAKSTGSILSGWFGKKKVSKTPEMPELPYEFTVKNLDEIPQKKPTHTPLRQLYRPSIAYRADWDSALREAIVDSYPGSMAALRASYPQNWYSELQAAVKASHVSPKITRKVASPRDWSNALHVAIISSYPETRFSRGQALPSQWNAALQKAIARSGAAQPSNFDVAVRHPVFMGTMETTAETIHPAIGPKTLKRKESTKKQAKSNIAIMSTPLLWEKPVEETVPVTNNLWSSKLMTKTASYFEAELDTVRHDLRKFNKITQRSAFDIEPNFSEQGMWRRDNSNNQGRDWLEDSMKKRFKRVELRY